MLNTSKFGKNTYKNNNDSNRVVLIADRTIMSEYHGFTDLGYISCFPTNLVPKFIRFLVYPRLKKDLFSYSLRRVESKLIDEGFNVITLRPQQIRKIKKIKPKIIGITVVDPITTKPYSWTMRNILGNTISVEEEEFSNILKNINEYRKILDFKIIIGGPGACEFERTDKYLDLFDYYVIGPGENAIELFSKILDNAKLPNRFVSKPISCEKEIPLIKKPARFGSVQITQGCPRCCDYCAAATVEWISFSKERILKELELNLRSKPDKISLITEDVLLYGAKDIRVNHEAVIDLFKSIKEKMNTFNINNLTISDVSIAAILDSKKTLYELTDVLNFNECFPPNPVIGVETGSIKLMNKWLRDKVKPFSTDKWPELVEDGVKTLNDNNWYPVASLISGLPGETEEDVIDTINLVDDIKDNSLTFAIFMFTPCPITNLKDYNGFTFEDISERQWELFNLCWTKTIKSMRKDINKFVKNIVVRFIVLGLLNQIEKDLLRFRNNPNGLRQKYSNLNLNGLKLLKYLIND